MIKKPIKYIQMKQRITTLLATLFLTGILFAQEKQSEPAKQPAAKPPAKPAAAQAPVPMNAKDTMLCKAWKPVTIERFKVVGKPEGAEKDDGVTFTLDGTVFLTMEGVQKTGTWKTDKTKKWITLTFDDGTSYRFQIFNLADNELYYEYQDKELVRTKYKCEPVVK